MNYKELRKRMEDLRGIINVYQTDSKQLLIKALDEFKNKLGKDCVELNYDNGETVYGIESGDTEVKLKGLSYDGENVTFHMCETMYGNDREAVMRQEDEKPEYTEIDLTDVAELVIKQIEEGKPFEA